MNKIKRQLVIVLVLTLVLLNTKVNFNEEKYISYYVKIGEDYQYRDYIPSSGYEYEYTKCNNSKYKKAQFIHPNSKIENLAESSGCDLYFKKIGEEGEESFSIIYELNGGVASNKESYKNTDEDFTLNNPVKEGYNFIGWTGSNGSVASTSVTIKKGSGGNKKYKANYIPINYFVAYDANGGTGAIKNTKHTYDILQPLAKNTFTKTNYSFIGWNQDKNATTSTYKDQEKIKNLTTKENETLTLYALWKGVPKEVNVTVLNGIINGESTKLIEYNREATFNLTPSEFYGEPTVSCTNNQVGKIENNILKIDNVTDDTTCTVTFKINKYNVNLDVVNGTSTEQSKTGNHSDNITFTVKPNTGYITPTLTCTNNQTGTIQNETLTINNLTNNTSCTLEYKPLTYQIKYNANGANGTMGNSVHTYDETKNLTTNTFTKVGYDFLGWSTNKDATTIEYKNNQSVKNLTTINNNVVNLYAIWKIKTYTVNATVLNGIIDGSTSKTVNHGVDATFNLTPSDFYGEPTVSCTNSQNGVMTNEYTLTINNITNNTTCTITYNEQESMAKDIIAKYSTNNNEGLIKINQPATLQTKATTEYRYSGLNVNNYVNFNGEVWRIIGVFDVEDKTGKIKKRVKIIRSSSIGNYSWDSCPTYINTGWGSNQWGPTGSYPGSDIMQELNDLYYNGKSGTCYTGISDKTSTCNFTNIGLKADARNMVDDALWYLGASEVNDVATPQSYVNERSNTLSPPDGGQNITKTTRWIGKIGLMYPSDYGYASSSCYSNTPFYNISSTDYGRAICTNSSWLYNTFNRVYQWTITPHKVNREYALYTDDIGRVLNSVQTYYTFGVMPTLYLSSKVKIASGTGTNLSPYNLKI